MNGVYLYQGIHHRAFGVLWWMTYEDNQYRIINLCNMEMVQHNTILTFSYSKPHPLLVNLHGMMGLLRYELTQAQLWKAGGERTDLFFPDDPLFPTSSSADTLGDMESPQGKQLDIFSYDMPP
ncbi:hypothetical protein SpCBS45565_g00962 [Spizellomyces sp. 'palustris']|nr:hypothetical protein SpCBS45565_g00962 [Spizellomyces sp. 'palustris']